MEKIKHFSKHVGAGDTDPKAMILECANFDHYYGGCLFRDECLVQQGEHCEYFERVILQPETIS
jgi:hypothetical protein